MAVRRFGYFDGTYWRQAATTDDIAIPHIGGVAAGGSTITTGTVVFADANGVYFGLDGSTVTASVVGGTGGAGITAVNFSAGGVSTNVSRLVFQNSNGVSFGLAGQTLTVSVQTAGGGGITGVNVSAGTTSQGLSKITFADANNVVFGLAGSAITASATFPAQTVQPGVQGLVAGTTTATTGTVVLSDANGISFGVDGQTVTASYTVPSTAGLISRVNLSAGAASADLSAVTFGNAGGVSFGLVGSVVTAAAPAAPPQTAQTQNVVVPAAGTQTATSGTVLWADSNGISFGMAGSTRITASYTVPSTAGLISAINVSAAGGTENVSALTFADANGVSFGIDAGVVTASVAAQPAGDVVAYATGVTTQSSQGTIPGSSLVFRGAGAASVGITNGSVVVSVAAGAQSAQTQNVVVPSAGTQTATSGTVVFADSNGIVFGMSGSTRITASYTVPSTAGLISAVNLSAGTASMAATAVTFADANNVVFGLDAGTLTASATFPAQTVQTVGVYGVGNTTQNSSTTRDARSLSFNGLGIVTVGFSNGSVQLSASQSVQTQGVVAPSAGTQTATTGTVVFANSNGIAFGMSGSSQITASYTVPSTVGLVSAINFSAGATSGNLKSVTFGDANGLAFGLDAGTITGSYTVPTQSAQTLGLYGLGNTTQNSSTTRDARSLSFNGLGIVTVGFSNGSVQVSATQSAQTQSVVVPSAGTQTATSGTVVFANSNGIAFGMSGSSQITASYTVPTQTNQTVGLYVLGNTTQNSSTTLDARTLSFNGLGIITAGFSNGSIQLSATQSAQTIGLFALGNTTQNSSTTRDARSLSFNGLGIATVGYSNGSIQVSVTQSAQTLGGYAIGNTTGQSSSSTIDARTLSFSGVGAASVGYSGGAVVVSVPAVVAQTNQTVGLYALGNTTQNSSTTLDARTLSFNGLGIVTAGFSNGSIQISATQSVQTQGIAAPSAGTQTATSGTVVFANSNGIAFGMSGSSQITASYTVPSTAGLVSFVNFSAGATSGNLKSVTFDDANNVSFGLDAGTITASASFPAQTNQTVGIYALGNTTQNSSTTRDARSLSFNGLGIVTVGYSNGSIQISATEVAQTNQTLGLYGVGNTTGQSSSSTFDARTMSFSGAGIASVGYSGGAVVVSVPSPAAQTNQTVGLYAVGNTTQNSSTTRDARSLSFNGLGIVTAGFSNGSVQISAVQTAQTQNVVVPSAGTQTATSGTVVYSNSNNLTFGMSGSSRVTASYAFNASATNASAAVNGLTFADGGGVSFGLNAGTITASYTVPAQTNQIVGLYASSNTTLTSSGTADARSLSFRGIGGVTVGVSANEVLISGATTAAQTNQTIGAYGVGNTTGQASSTTFDARTLSFSALGNVSVGYSAGAVVISGTAAAQTNQTVGRYGLGNTTGQASSTTADARSLSLSGLGAASVGYSAGAAVISVPTGASATGNFGALAAGGQTQTSGTVIFADSNGLAFGLNAGTITASYTVPTQSNQTVGMYASGQTTGQSSSSTVDIRSMTFRGVGAVSMGMSAGLMLVSVDRTQAWFALGNTTQNSSTALDNRSMSLNGLGIVTVGYSNGSMQISATQSNQVVTMFAASNTTQSSTGTANASSLVFAGAGIASVGVTGGSVVISVPAGGGAAGTNTLGVSNLGNTVGTSGVVTGSALQVVFAGGNNVTLSQSINGSSATVTISAFNQSVQSIGLYASSNTTLTSSGTADARSLSFRGIGGVSVGVSGNEVLISGGGGAQTNQTIGFYGLGNTTQNSSTTLDARTVSFNGLGAMTVGYSNGSVQLSAPATSSLSATGALSISTNGATISMGVPLSIGGVAAAGGTATSGAVSFANGGGVSFGMNGQTMTASVAAIATQSAWIGPSWDASWGSGQYGNGNAMIWPIQVDQDVAFSALRHLMAGSISSSSNSSHAGTLSIAVGLYTRNVSTLSQVLSASRSFAWSNTSNNSISVLTGVRDVTFGFQSTLTPGDYWLVLWSRTSSANANWHTMRNIMESQFTNPYNGEFMQAANATRQMLLGLGMYSVSSATMRGSYAFSDLNGTAGTANIVPIVGMFNVTA